MTVAPRAGFRFDPCAELYERWPTWPWSMSTSFPFGGKETVNFE
jgi:hypothetical protein